MPGWNSGSWRVDSGGRRLWRGAWTSLRQWWPVALARGVDQLETAVAGGFGEGHGTAEDGNRRRADSGVRRGESGSPRLWPAARTCSRRCGSAAGGGPAA
jgi:hypothetical protein